MHLQIAEAIKARVEQDQDERLQRRLCQEWPAFYLGSVAADFQTICDVPRFQTHFYQMPPADDDEAYPAMLSSFPELADASALSPDRALFVAAYIAHLLLDLLWFRQILIPYFVEACNWGDFSQRRLVHHILLSYLDKLAFDSLPPSAATVLAAAQPKAWLPFAADDDLIAWRDLLVAQLQPGAKLETVTIYAERIGMSPDEFLHKLEDPEWIEAQVFKSVPVGEVQSKLAAAVPHCIHVITDYLSLR